MRREPMRPRESCLRAPAPHPKHRPQEKETSAQGCGTNSCAILQARLHPVRLHSVPSSSKPVLTDRKTGQSDFSDWPLFMPAMTAVYPELAEGLPHTSAGRSSALRGLNVGA